MDFVKKLKAAIGRCDEKTVNRLLKGGVDVNGRYWYDSTLLHEAVTVGNMPIVKSLIKVDANVRAKNRDGRTPLHIASRSGCVDILCELIKAGADVNGKTEDGKTCLHISVWRGHANVVKALLDAGAAVNVQDSCGWTPISWASRLNYLRVVDLLVQKGAFINYKSQKVHTPLLEAFRFCHMDVARFLILHGADVNLTCPLFSLPEMLLKHEFLSRTIIEENLDLLQTAGYDFRGDVHMKQTRIDHHNGTCTNPHATTFNEWFDNHHESCAKLSHLCRTRIRRRLSYCARGRSICNAVDLLPLPDVITDFLLLKGEVRDVH